MQRALGSFRNGRVELSMPVDWPEGTLLQLTPLSSHVGMTEADWPTTHEGVQSLLRNIDRATAEDDAPVDFADKWPEWDAHQIETVRKEWDDMEQSP